MENKILEILSIVPDPRVERSKLHLLSDILFIALCAVIAGAETYTEMASFGKIHFDWFKRFLKLPNGIPSHDTFGRVLSLIDPKALNQCLIDIVGVIREKNVKDKHIAIDGKTLRRSFNKGQKPIHVISAWASEHGVVLGQIKTEEKSNEITAIPELINMLCLEEALVSIDAMGCQKKIAKQILDRKGDYLLALKQNQKALYEEVNLFFESDLSEIELSTHKEIDSGHGRIETRKSTVCRDIDWLQEKENWPSLRAIIKIESIREIDGEEQKETRYYISSKEISAKEALEISRRHWGIENSLHWVLDVIFKEDSCRIRKKNGPENMAVLRRMAMNLCKQNKKSKLSMRAQRKKAGWDIKFLEKLILQKF